MECAPPAPDVLTLVIPRRCAPRASATSCGCLFVTAERVDELLRVAHEIRQRERHQAEAIKSGRSLQEQLEFAQYLEKRATDPSYTFREHLRKMSGAIEE
jgi:4-hydroxy-4-methyl-2-oxoglutarate aldolase